MEEMKIGAITIGQAPRTDVTDDIMHIFGEHIELLQRGGLDGLTRTEIDAFAPEEDDYILVSRLTDGSSVTFAERCILPRLQQCIDDLEKEGVHFIMFFCTGSFPSTLHASVPLIYPCHILHSIVPLLTKKSHIIDVTPSQLQVEQSRKKWKKYVADVTVVAASPYGDFSHLEEVADTLGDMEGDLIVLDCIGYTQQMKQMFAQKTGKLVVLSRSLLARTVSELTAIDARC